jgi:hypothetical protein
VRKAITPMRERGGHDKQASLRRGRFARTARGDDGIVGLHGQWYGKKLGLVCAEGKRGENSTTYTL